MVGFAQNCEAALPEGKCIYLRSDSAAYQAAVINRYNQAGRSFTITADQDAAVKREIQNLAETAWTPYRTSDGLATDRQIAETVHTMNGTEQAFRLIVLRGPTRSRTCLRHSGIAITPWPPTGRRRPAR